MIFILNFILRPRMRPTLRPTIVATGAYDHHMTPRYLRQSGQNTMFEVVGRRKSDQWLSGQQSGHFSHTFLVNKVYQLQIPID